MKKVLLAGVAALAIAGSTVVYAQHRPWFHEHMRMSPEDRAAFADARIAAVHAGLKLTPDQEKLWPPVEAAVRDFAKLRIDRANARMNAKQDDTKDAQKPGRSGGAAAPARRQHGGLGAALKKIADAADPLYKTLDDGQKRRLRILTHMERRFGGGGWRHREFERGRDRRQDQDRATTGIRGRPGRDRAGPGAALERL